MVRLEREPNEFFLGLCWWKDLLLKSDLFLVVQEKEALIAEWQPEPLTPETPYDDTALANVKNRVVSR